MDLILLQPGDQSLFAGLGAACDGGSMIPDDLSLGGCIELASVQQGIRQQISADASDLAATADRPIITAFTCVKYVDRLSVKFYDHCLRAQPLGVGAEQPTLIHVLRRSGDKNANIITFSLRDAIVSEIQFQSNPADMPTEQFKLNFTEILWTYTIQQADGTPSGTVSAGWSLRKNQPIAAFTG